MIYFYGQQITEYKHTDAKRFTIEGYPGDIYKAIDTAEYGGGVEHCTEWVEKYGYTIKTKAEAQELVNAGVIELNNFYNGQDAELGGAKLVQGAITLE
tara:strand:- start:41 stop:334 length:294 start_codon:yes stop_codon:yes gene_type:complete